MTVSSATEASTSGAEDPIRVVVFTSGPALEPAAGEFIVRLEDHAEIELVGVFHQTRGLGLRRVWEDLCRRRGLLAPPLFVLHGLRQALLFLPRPDREIRRRRRLAAIATRVHHVADLHATDTVDRIRQTAPQLGLIYGAPILKPAVFEIPARGTLGIHHGRLPDYRGKKTTFWAMFDGAPSAGVTIQRVNAGLDTGEIVAEGSVPIRRRSLRDVWKRLEALGIDLYLESILEMKRGTATFRQPIGRRRPLCRDPRPRDILVFWGHYLYRLVRGPKTDEVRRAP
jgi:folate-dependent phosphoribosylglycinamide formyltransferase PurN